MELRSVTGANRHLAVELLARFFAEEGFSASNGRLERNVELIVDDASCWAALAVIGHEAAGVVTVTTMLYVEWGRLGEIGDLYVVPEHRGRGVGTFLASGAADWCKRRGCSAVSVVVTPRGDLRHGLSQFYKRLLFEPSGRTFLYRQL